MPTRKVTQAQRTLSVSIALTMVILPIVAIGAVRINEIAWMGTSKSSTDEWIELYNNGGESVDLTGWKLAAEDGSLSLKLSGQMLGNSYYLIERTDDSTVPSTKADLIQSFGKGLSNNGETLVLYDKNNSQVDSVVGGTGWKIIGGDNATKATAQRTKNGNWITAIATPREENNQTPQTILIPPVKIKSQEIKTATPPPPKQKVKLPTKSSQSKTVLSEELVSTEGSLKSKEIISKGTVLFGAVQKSTPSSDGIFPQSPVLQWTGLGLLILLSGFAGRAYLQVRHPKTEAEQYTIIEDIIDEDGKSSLV